MDWNEVTTTDITGTILVVKDAMVMLDEGETSPDWPHVVCAPGEYIFEIHVPTPFHARLARIRLVGSDPVRGEQIGSVDVDNGFIGIIDYEGFAQAVTNNYDDYEEWTATVLDDELALNFSGEVGFDDARLLYVKTGDGDGRYACFELLQDGAAIGIECVFKA